VARLEGRVRTNKSATGPVGRMRSAYGPALREDPSFLPALAATCIFVWFAVREAGFGPTTWYPGGLMILALLAVALVALPAPRPSRLTLASVLLLGGYAAWSLLSITWAPDKGAAWTGADRTVVFAAAYALFALWPMRGRAAQILLAFFGLAVAVIGLVVLLRAQAATDPSRFFFEARFAEPAGYVNANVALWFLGFWPCVLFAARRETPAPLRGAFLGGAALLIGMALLGQSRGWLVAVPPVVLLAVLMGPNRGRVIVALGVLAVAAAVMWQPALDLFDQYEPGDDLSGPLSDAVRPILSVSGLLCVLGTAVGVAETRVAVAPRTGRALERLILSMALIVALAGLTVYAAAEGSPLSRASEYWQEFKEVESARNQPGRRLTGPPSTRRYDFWRVGMELFRERPFTGYGADNFEQQYLIRGKTSEQPRYPHSLEVRVLQQTGLVGAFLLGGALICAFAAGGRALRKRRDATAVTAAGGILMAAYWLAHGSVDWLWEFPGLSCPALAMLGLAAAVADRAKRETADAGASPGSEKPTLAIVGGFVACLAAAAAFIPPWLSEREVREAASGWRNDPQGAVERLDRAAALNPLSDVPYLTAGAIAVQMQELQLGAQQFRTALERNGERSYTYLQLGAIASEQGRRSVAIESLTRAVALSPRDDLPRRALRSARRGVGLKAANFVVSPLRDGPAQIGGG